MKRSSSAFCLLLTVLTSPSAYAQQEPAGLTQEVLEQEAFDSQSLLSATTTVDGAPAASAAANILWGEARAIPSEPRDLLLLEDTRLVLAATDDGVYQTGMDAGGWTLMEGSSDHAQDLAAAPDGRIYLATIGDGVSVSADGGATWTVTSLRSVDPVESVHILSVSVSVDGTVYAGAFQGGVYKSADGGDTWTELPTKPGFSNSVRALLPLEARLLAGPGTYGIKSTVDGGVTWQGVSASEYAAYDFTSGGTRLFSSGTSRNGGLYTSDDGGASWSRRAAIPGAGHYLGYHEGVVVVGAPSSLGGVQVTDYDVSRWLSINEGIAGADIGGLAVDSEGYIYVVTEGGLQRSTAPVTAAFAPTLTSPADGATGIPVVSTTFEYETTTRGDLTLEIATDAEFVGAADFTIENVSQSVIDTPSFYQALYAATVAGLEPGQTYYWRVTNTTAEATSPLWSFSTEPDEPPAFTSSPVTAVTEGQPYEYVASATDPNGLPVSISAPTLPGWLSLTDNEDGTITLAGTPFDADVGDHPVVLVADDGTSTAEQSFTVAVGDVNNAPVAARDSVGTLEEVSVTVAVLANDTDADGDPLTVTGSEPGSNGTTTTDGTTVTYTPVADFVGDDAFTYLVSDGTTTTVGTVVVTVSGRNDAPSPTDDAVETDEDDPVVVAVLDNDSDVDEGTDLVITAVSEPENGTATLNDDGTVTYAPKADYFGVDTFTYTVDDGDGPVGTPNGRVLRVEASATATVTVTVRPVNDAPVFTSEPDTTAVEGQPYSYTVVVEDVEGDPITFGTPGAPWLSLTDHGDGTATLAGTPTDADVGSYVEVLTASDGNLTAEQRFPLVVAQVNGAPVAVADEVETDEDEAVAVDVLSNDFDTDIMGDLSLIVTEVTEPEHGTAVLGDDGAVTYTPAPDFYGEDSFTYTIDDEDGPVGSVSRLSSAVATATVTVTVRPVNDPPTVLAVRTPADGETITLIRNGEPRVFTAAWPPGTDVDDDVGRLSYRWEIASTNAFDPVLIGIEPGTGITGFSEVASSIHALLDRIGVGETGSVTLFQRVVVSDQEDESVGPVTSFTLERVGGVATELIPEAFALRGTHPNPTMGHVAVLVDLPTASMVRFDLYDPLGRRVAGADVGSVSAGSGQRVDVDLSGVAPGMYVYRLTATAPGVAEEVTGQMTVAR